MPEGGQDDSGQGASDRGLILLVEDDVRTRRLERFVLEEEGFSVREANSGEEALEALVEARPALVLLDIGLPGINGFVTCQRIRQTSQVPVIMVTGENRDEDKVRGLEIGADDYVTKPFATTELVARVKAVIRRSGPIPVADIPRQDDPGVPVVPGGNGPPVTDAETFEGIVRLAVASAGSVRGMIRFVDELRQSTHFQLLRLVADQHKGEMSIQLRLRGPLALQETLLQMEGVSNVEVAPETEGSSGERLLRVSLGGTTEMRT